MPRFLVLSEEPCSEINQDAVWNRVHDALALDSLEPADRQRIDATSARGGPQHASVKPTLSSD